MPKPMGKAIEPVKGRSAKIIRQIETAAKNNGKNIVQFKRKRARRVMRDMNAPQNAVKKKAVNEI